MYFMYPALLKQNMVNNKYFKQVVTCSHVTLSEAFYLRVLYFICFQGVDYCLRTSAKHMTKMK